MAYSTEVLADSPAIYLPCQETSGTTAADSSGNSRNGTYAGTVVVNDTTDAAAPVGVGKHVRFDGTSGHIAFPGGTWFAPAGVGFTFEGWFYIRSWTNWARIFDFAPAASTQDTYYTRSGIATSKMRLQVAGTNDTDATNQIATGAWKHVAVAVTSTGAHTVYVNGSLWGTGTAGAPTSVNRTLMYIGRSVFAGDPYLAASVSQLALYNSVLSSTRVAAHYVAGTSGPGASLSLTGTLPAVTASLALATYTDTRTENLGNGRRRRGAFVDASPDPVATLPANLARRVDKAIAYPTPTLVNGRPT